MAAAAAAEARSRPPEVLLRAAAQSRPEPPAGPDSCSIMGDRRELHGAPFPLVLRASADDRRGAPRYLARRHRRHAAAEELVAGGVAALNALVTARGNGLLVLEEPRRVQSEDQLSVSQDAVLRNLGRAASACLPVPCEREMFEDGALCELLRAKDVYDLGQDTSVAPYDKDKLAVLRGATRPLDAKHLVGEKARQYLEYPDRLIVLPPDQLLEVSDPVRPH